MLAIKSTGWAFDGGDVLIVLYFHQVFLTLKLYIVSITL